ncbi:hypothetical protein GCM10008949_33860 [Deinococcus humi]|nr:hypothetical protein GCM10008949_33860 [Deinococcus humi]
MAQLEFAVVHQLLNAQQLGGGAVDLSPGHDVKVFLSGLQLAAGDGLAELRVRAAVHADHVVGVGGVLVHFAPG